VRQKTEWVRGLEAGILIAANHLDYVGEDKLRDEVLRLQGLTLADLRESRTA
jgi:hypothetical protein